MRLRGQDTAPPGAVGLPVGWGPVLLQLRAQVKAGGGGPLGLCPEAKLN